MFLWAESVLGKGSCAATPVPYCQFKDSPVACCLGTGSTAADGAVPAPCCPPSSDLQRKNGLCQPYKRKRNQPLPLPPAPCVSVRGLASLPAGMNEMIVQPVHPLLSMGEQAHPCVCGKASSLPTIYCKQPADVLHPGGLPGHLAMLIHAEGEGEGPTFKAHGGRFSAGATQRSLLASAMLHQLKTCSLLLPELMYFPFLGQGQSCLVVIIVMKEVEVNLCFRMSINARACIHTFQKQREITH